MKSILNEKEKAYLTQEEKLKQFVNESKELKENISNIKYQFETEITSKNYLIDTYEVLFLRNLFLICIHF